MFFTFDNMFVLILDMLLKYDYSRFVAFEETVIVSRGLTDPRRSLNINTWTR